MLIPFDQFKYTPPVDEEPKPSEIVWLNPTYVVSVRKLPQDRFSRDRADVTMSSREDEESNDSYTVIGHADYIAKIVNTAILGPVSHFQGPTTVTGKVHDNA